MHEATVHRNPSAHQRSDSARSDPEGRPAHPEIGTKSISILLMSVVVALLVAAIVLAIFTTWPFAVAVGALGLLLYVGNPVVWAAILRTQDTSRFGG